MQDKKKPQHHSLSRAFRTAVLAGITTVAALTGMAGQAQAQTVQYQDTAQSQPQKPWARDPEYQRQLQAAQQLEAIHMQQLEARESADLARARAGHDNTVSREIQNVRNTGRQRGGFNFGNILQNTSQVGAEEQRYRADVVNIQANYESARLREEDNFVRTEQNLDNQYARKYGYTAAQVSGYYTPQQQARPSSGGPGALSPQEQHDRLVRAYQDAQLNAAKAGKPMPNPQQYGLSPRDPAIQP